MRRFSIDEFQFINVVKGEMSLIVQDLTQARLLFQKDYKSTESDSSLSLALRAPLNAGV